MIMLLLSVATLALGPVLYRVAGDRQRWMSVLDGFVVLAVGTLVVAHLLPDSIEKAGWGALAPLIIGLLGPTLAERWLQRVEAHTHKLIIVLVVLGLSLHAAVDGMALALPSDTHWHALPIAVVLHRFPAGLVVWRLLRPDSKAAMVLALIAATTVVGFVAGESWLQGLQTPALGMFEALVAGSLLHVVVHGMSGR